MRAAAVSRGHSGSPVRALARLLAWAVQTALLLAIVACALMCLAGWQMYREAAAAKSLEERVEAVRLREGYTTIDQLPEFYLDAVVAAEDHRFWSHSGVDVLATARAAWNDLKSWSLREGGSTITQQLAKNLCFTQEKRFTRKIAEVFAALRLPKPVLDGALRLSFSYDTSREDAEALVEGLRAAKEQLFTALS